MKTVTYLVLTLFVAVVIVSGCAPSVTVTKAGHERQFEVTVSSNEFGLAETQELLDEWHKQARSSCYGGDYRVVTRDILQREDPFDEILITGIIECD
jgi:hypothetical protein